MFPSCVVWVCMWYIFCQSQFLFHTRTHTCTLSFPFPHLWLNFYSLTSVLFNAFQFSNFIQGHLRWIIWSVVQGNFFFIRSQFTRFFYFGKKAMHRLFDFMGDSFTKPAIQSNAILLSVERGTGRNDVIIFMYQLTKRK